MYQVRLAVFEGPLDLLLHLIEKQEVDIWDVSMAEIARQYLDFLAQVPRVELEEAGEYLAMAALLVRIKARHLLPHVVVEEEDEEEEAEAAALEEELRRRLAEYKRFKEAADVLAGLAAARALLGVRPSSPSAPGPMVDPGPPPGFHVEKLMQAFVQVMSRKPSEPPNPPVLRKVDLRGAMVRVRRMLRQAQGALTFRALFPRRATRWDWIVTFLAVLELVHMGRVRVRQDEPFGDLHLELVAG